MPHPVLFIALLLWLGHETAVQSWFKGEGSAIDLGDFHTGRGVAGAFSVGLACWGVAGLDGCGASDCERSFWDFWGADGVVCGAGDGN